jgi:hypothetical protein
MMSPTVREDDRVIHQTFRVATSVARLHGGDS